MQVVFFFSKNKIFHGNLSETRDSWSSIIRNTSLNGLANYFYIKLIGLIGSVLEYDSVCFMNLAKTHKLCLERVQYRALRIALGLMGSTPNNCLGVLSGIPPLAEKIRKIPCCCFLSIGSPFEGEAWCGADRV
jgi:hypothetical protein